MPARVSSCVNVPPAHSNPDLRPDRPDGEERSRRPLPRVGRILVHDGRADDRRRRPPRSILGAYLLLQKPKRAVGGLPTALTLLVCVSSLARFLPYWTATSDL